METWRQIPGYEGLYEVNDRGEVRRLPSVDVKGRRVRGGILTPTGRARDGYLTVRLCNGAKRTHYIHRLVAEAFCRRRPGAGQVNHKNGDKGDNRASNLEWVTVTENHHHRADVLGVHVRGSGHGIAKLTEDDVREIRRIGKQMTGRALAKKFDVSPATISLILSGQVWSWLE